jgi:hypothetical protein
VLYTGVLSQGSLGEESKAADLVLLVILALAFGSICALVGIFIYANDCTISTKRKSQHYQEE